VLLRRSARGSGGCAARHRTMGRSMTEREQNEARPDADPADPEVERSSSSPLSEQKDAGRPTDQAIINEQRALESGEENVV
jgi:hypothetical protein